jgi:beta-glucanase (GH16 family)
VRFIEILKRVVIIVIAELIFLPIGNSAASSIAPPEQASSAGFSKLAFDDEFGDGSLDVGYGTDGHKWNAGLWWEKIPSPSAFSVDGGVLTITASATQAVDLCTQFHDATGGTYFKGGYFEAYMNCTDWSAFWLFCADRPHVWGNQVLPSNPMTWTNEIDVIETDGKFPNTAVCTLHKNTSGDGGVPDQINQPNNFPLNQKLLGGWHTYGVLWTTNQVTWYVDNIKVATTAPFQSTWQPVQLILTAAPGGVNGSPSTVLPPTTQVKWVRVWEN